MFFYISSEIFDWF